MSGPPGETSGDRVPLATLRARAVRGTFWWMVVHPLLKAIQLGSNVVLAWLLSPATFGVVAVASIAVRAVTMFTEVGVDYTLIQSARTDDRFVNTAWTLQVARGGVLCLLAAALAVPLSHVYSEPELVSIMPVIGVGALVGALRSTKYVTLNRTLDERPRALLGLAETIITRGAMIAIAFVWPTAFALVLGGIIGTAFATSWTHLLPGIRNRLQWDRESARVLFRTGSWVTVGTIVAYLGGQVDTLALGHVAPEHLDAMGLVGVYTMAQRVARLPLEVTEIATGALAFPLLTELARREPAKFRERLGQVKGVFLPLGATLCVAVVVLSPWFFGLLYDERYHAAEWMALLSTAKVWTCILNTFTNEALLALGRTKVSAMAGAAGAAMTLVGALAGAWIAGVPGFILGLAVGDLTRHLIGVYVLCRLHGPVHRQDLAYTGLLLLVAGTCFFLHAWGSRPDAAAAARVVGQVGPFVVLAVLAGWSGARAWRLVRR